MPRAYYFYLGSPVGATLLTVAPLRFRAVVLSSHPTTLGSLPANPMGFEVGEVRQAIMWAAAGLPDL